jgi:hypothetical protein
VQSEFCQTRNELSCPKYCILLAHLHRIPKSSGPLPITPPECSNIIPPPKVPPLSIMMNHYDSLLNGPEVLPTVLPRTTGIVDFSKLFRKHRHISHEADSKRSVSTVSSRHPEENGSENSQILHMAPPKRPRRIDRSLSSISNNSGRRLDGSSDEKEEDETKQAAEELSWNIIDREIFEWQYVCQTGRPYWWSPESKYLHLKRVPPKLTNELKSKTWLRSTDDCPKPKTTCGAPRRSLSDSYLTNPNTVHDLAHLVAVQLLSSCFTLLPDHIIGLPSPNYGPLDKSTVSTLPDPSMISSLRMHTHFRYSPSFGHEARNTSPVQLWSGSTDGPSPRSYTPPNASTSLPTPDIGTSGRASRRPRLRRALHTTEVSTSEQSLESESCEYAHPCRDRDGLDHSPAATAPPRRGRIHDPTSGTVNGSLRPGEATRRSGDGNRRSSRYRPSTSQEPSREYGGINTSGSYRGVQPSFPPPKTNYHLQPVIRSEPHHVFIQPVKELVVKRWKKLRHRFSGSLHSPLPASRSEDQSCTSGTSGASSPGMSSDAKIRRRRAQGRGDIHSTSIDSTPHYNSPVSGDLAPISGASFWVDSRSRTPDFQFAKPIVAAASFAAETNTTSLGGNPIAQQPSSASDISRGIQQSSSALAICGSGHSRLGFSLSSKSTHPTSPHPFPSRRGPGRARRRSMLSEVHTPEFRSAITANADGDHEPVEPGILSVGTIIPISKDEDMPRAPDPRGETPDTLSIPTSPQLLGTGVVAQERPRMMRMSTNGTQVFTPSEDGMELDGLPVGPGKDLWVAKGKTSDSTYLM